MRLRITVRPALSSRLRLILCLVLIAGVGLFTAVAYVGSTRRLATQANDTFQRITDDYAASLMENIEGHGDMLYATRGLSTATTIKSQTWSSFIRGQYAFDRYPGLQVLGLARTVEASAIAAHETRTQKEIGKPFKIHPRVDGRQVVLDYIETRGVDSPNDSPALGFNLMSEPIRKKAIEQADASGNITATAPVKLVGRKGPGFLLILPLSSPDGFRTYSVSALDIQTLVEGTLQSPLNRYSTALLLADTTDAAPHILYSTPAPTGNVVKRTVTIQIANRQWEATFQAPKNAMHVATGRFAPLALLAGGIVIMLVVAVMFYSMSIRKRLHRLTSP